MQVSSYKAEVMWPSTVLELVGGTQGSPGGAWFLGSLPSVSLRGHDLAPACDIRVQLHVAAGC